MKKHKNFIARLLHRNNTGACEDAGSGEPELTVIVMEANVTVDAVDPIEPEESESSEAAMPTLCKDGKLFRARLKNGRWETMGPPIGDC